MAIPYRQLFITSFSQAIQELRVNKLRTFLSLLGITIGIFCIIAVFTVLDSMEDGIRKNMESLGSDVIYVNRKPWMAEDGEYKWWEYLQRPPMTISILKNIQHNLPNIAYSTLAYPTNGNIKYNGKEISNGFSIWGVTENYEMIQSLNISLGRYINKEEIAGGANVMVLGKTVADELFENKKDPTGTSIQLFGKNFKVIGIIKKMGKTSSGFQLDESIIIPFQCINAVKDTHSKDWNNDPILMLKAKKNTQIDEVKEEVIGQIRKERKIKPGNKNDFSLNLLSSIAKKVTEVFGIIDMIGLFIGGFAILVGAFGIANIMFVSVKERTRFIGLKKAIGAQQFVILTEFLLEAVILCTIGGLIGILFVYLMGLGLTYGADFEVHLTLKNILIGLSISITVGLIAGFIPAYRASKLNPVVAIRSI